jgi:predicted RNA-binding Zn-ribbon protein involved in translation (DUF1610 family)
MVVDGKGFENLKKSDFEINKHISVNGLPVKIISAPDFKKEAMGTMYIYYKRVYFIYGFWRADNMCFTLENLKDLKKEGNIIEIYTENEEVIKVKCMAGGASPAYNILIKHLNGTIHEEVENYNEIKEEKELKKIKKKEEEEKRREEYKRTKELYQKSRIEAANRKAADTTVRCPKCGSTSITANKKGFSLAKGALGVATVGVYGAVAAGHGKNKVLVTCLNCGKQWKPGK